jgi:hypothetical protein
MGAIDRPTPSSAALQLYRVQVYPRLLLHMGLRQVRLQVLGTRLGMAMTKTTLTTVIVVLTLQLGALLLPAKACAQSGGAFCRLPRIVNQLPKDAVLDTTWRNVEPPVQVCRVMNHKNLWAASYSWFQLDARPGLTLTFEQLDSLFSAGEIAETTRVATVRLEYPIRARSFAEARRAAVLRPRGIDSLE